jgi:hypothetical protein
MALGLASWPWLRARGSGRVAVSADVAIECPTFGVLVAPMALCRLGLLPGSSRSLCLGRVLAAAPVPPVMLGGWISLRGQVPGHR